ncbi:MAG TPA: hypothetical protein DCE43_04870 [Planctomycetaceae bacterium]|nr:hypothetical protein [Planctomycetaceae bacterium]|tara:strand:- start:17 stop:478 length:462 start_codon:yes stop_codon:yes gene_type:complete
MVVAAPLGAKRSEREEQVIKGPGIRLDLDVRRVWRCPKCQRVLKTAGHITSRRCPIDDEFMQLDDSAQRAARRFTFPSIMIEQVDEVDTIDVEHPDTEQPVTDDDRPRKQSRKQKRRHRRSHDNDGEEMDDAEPTSPDDEPDTDTENQPSLET